MVFEGLSPFTIESFGAFVCVCGCCEEEEDWAEKAAGGGGAAEEMHGDEIARSIGEGVTI